MTRPTSEIARHAVAYGAGSIVGGISRAILLPVIARTLTKDEFGVLSLLLAATNLLHLCFELGLVTALIRAHHENADPTERHRLRSAAFVALPALDVLLAIPFLLARGWISRVLFGDPVHGALVALSVGTAFFAAQLQLFLGHLRAQDRSRHFAIAMAVKGAVSLTVTLLLVFPLGMGVAGFLLGNLAGPAAVALLAVPRLLTRGGVDLRGARTRLRGLLAFGVPLVPSALGLWLLTHFDAYLLRVLADLGAVGIYSFGSELCLPIALLFASFHLAWPPFAFARARRPGGPEDLARVFRHFFVVLAGFALAVAVLRREILAVVGTREYGGAIPVIPLVALATVLYGASQVFGTGLQVAGDTRRLPFYVLAATATNVVLNLLLIPAYRELGAAAATVITNVALCALVLRESNRQFRIPFEPGKLLRILLAAGILLLVTDAYGALPFAAGLAARAGTLLLFPLLLVPAGAVSAAELRAVPSVLREVARIR
jgi:O-antigen/teichoic acid export membrane protein